MFSIKSAKILIHLLSLISVSITVFKSFLPSLPNELESSYVFRNHFLNFFLIADFPPRRFMIFLIVFFHPINSFSSLSKFSLIQLLSQMFTSLMFVFSIFSVIASLPIFSNFDRWSNGLVEGVFEIYIH